MEERYDEDGVRRALTPQEVAYVDQVSAAFKDLTNTLVDIHSRAAELILADPGDARGGIRAIQDELFEVMNQEFLADDGLNKACSYIMYLIDMVAAHRAQRMKDGGEPE